MTVKKVPVAAGWRENFQGSFAVPCNIRPRSKSCSTLLCLTTYTNRERIRRKGPNNNVKQKGKTEYP